MRKALAIIGLGLLATACSSGPGALPKVPDFTPAPTTTTEFDYSDVPLKGVTGHGPTTSIAIGPGQATISGTVTGDQGPVAGATVQVDRIANGAQATTTVLSADDGTWTLPQVLGGHYRARAWRTPDLAQTTWTAVFVGATETKTVDLRVRTVGGLTVDASIAPDPPVVGQPANLVALVTVKEVDAQGVVRATPQTNVEVQLLASGGWRVLSTNPTVTDFNGEAQWSLRCRVAGHQTLA
ncbi:MAG TPA: carboxypeptidase-like regulatory domain-containing protein, partial [Acidimicrobiales bacterium]|nr:carboxypeptidase-like regulatory domain-containing protein [Acidimicrobiales bacterium]